MKAPRSLSKVLKDVPTIPTVTLRKLRALIRSSKWKTASSAAYRNAPHCYIIAFWFPADTKTAAFDDKTPWNGSPTSSGSTVCHAPGAAIATNI